MAKDEEAVCQTPLCVFSKILPSVKCRNNVEKCFSLLYWAHLLSSGLHVFGQEIDEAFSCINIIFAY